MFVFGVVITVFVPNCWLKVEFIFENAFSKYSKFGGVTGVFEGAHILKLFRIKLDHFNKFQTRRNTLTDKLFKQFKFDELLLLLLFD